MTDAQIKDRCLRALRSGGLYDGLIALVVGAPTNDVRRALLDLRDEGRVIRNLNTWRLADESQAHSVKA